MPPRGQLLAALHPNLGIAAQYQRKLAALIDAMHPEMLAIINLSAASPHRPSRLFATMAEEPGLHG